MEFTAEDAKVLIRAAWAVLSSPLAQRVYVLVIGCLAMGLSYWLALTANNHVAKTFEKTMKAVRSARKGRPTTEDGKNRRRKRMRQIKFFGFSSAIGWASVSLMFGVAAPATALFLATRHFSWFGTGGQHLVTIGSGPTNHISHDDTIFFVADQTLRGGLFDLLEVFDLQVTSIHNNPDVLTFTLGLFFYHLFVESFVFSGLFKVGGVGWRLSRTT